MKGLPVRCAFLTTELERAHDGAAVVMEGLLAHLELEPRDQGLVKLERHPGALCLGEPFVGVTRSLRRFDRSVFQHVLFFENAISMLESTTDGPLCRRNPTPFTHDSGWWETTPGVQPVLVRPTGRADRPGRLAGSRGRAQHYESLDPRATLYIMERFVNVSVVPR